MTKRLAIAQTTARYADEAPTRKGRLAAVRHGGPAELAPVVDGKQPASSAKPRRHLMKIPALECPYLPAVHPAADEMHEQAVQWAQAMGLVRKQAHIDKLRESRIGHLVARVFPATTDMVALQLAVDWTTLFCCLDDYLEQIHGAVLSAAYLRGLLGVFRDGAQPPLIDPFSHGFRDLRERMLDLRIPNWIPRFSACVERLFNAFVDEAKYRTIGVIPEFASHRRIRQITVGLYTGFLLGELTEGIVLPPEVMEHDDVRALERACSTIVGLANDIYTVEKEIAKGEVNNTVLVLMHQDGLSFEEAMTHTVRLHNVEMREFSRLAESLPQFDEQTDRQLRRYVEVLKAFISGHDEWARQTGRYTEGIEPDDDDGAA